MGGQENGESKLATPLIFVVCFSLVDCSKYSKASFVYFACEMENLLVPFKAQNEVFDLFCEDLLFFLNPKLEV